jgi:ATP-binding cassette, subfamily B, bacterial
MRKQTTASAPSLVLDEPTAQLGVADDEKIIPVLRTWAKETGRTVLLISHRFANLSAADCIFYFKQGKVLEQGTHSELIHLQGEYCERYTKESSAYQKIA